jgi:mevalonate kinase
VLDATKRIIRMTQEAARLKDHNEIALKQFQIAASQNNVEEMEKARVAAHEFLDQILDLHQELANVQNKQINDIINKLSGQG